MVFFSSTSHVYSLTTKKIKEDYLTQPSTKYGKTKLIAEKYIIKKLKKIKKSQKTYGYLRGLFRPIYQC